MRLSCYLAWRKNSDGGLTETGMEKSQFQSQTMNCVHSLPLVLSVTLRFEPSTILMVKLVIISC